MRLFIAIQFDDEILDALTDFQNNMKLSGVSGNFTRRENMHVTLAFIGEYNDPYEVLEVIADTAFEPFDISVEGVGMFKDVFWVGLAKNPRLESYVRRLRKNLSDNGIPFDRKGFMPHITLIRQPRHKDYDKIPVYLPPRGTMTVTGVSLMKSERGKSGMIYTEIE